MSQGSKPAESKDAREARLAKALRANLKRRKAQGRRPDEAGKAPGEPSPEKKDEGRGQD